MPCVDDRTRWSEIDTIDTIKPSQGRADKGSIMTRALSLLAGFASPVFLCAAIAGWLFEVWPANPVTLGISGLLVLGGPVLGIVHVATAEGLQDEDEVEEETVELTAPVLVRRPVPAPLLLTEKAAAAARFASWRDTPNAAIEQRERARRASQYIRG
jgi:hypothetical protein